MGAEAYLVVGDDVEGDFTLLGNLQDFQSAFPQSAFGAGVEGLGWGRWVGGWVGWVEEDEAV